MTPWFVVAFLAALAVRFASRAHALRIHALATPKSARQKIEYLFLATDDDGARRGLKRAMDLIDLEEDAEPSGNDYQEVVGDLGRHAQRTGDDRAGMLEALAAALNHPEFAAEIEAAIWVIILRDQPERGGLE